MARSVADAFSTIVVSHDRGVQMRQKLREHEVWVFLCLIVLAQLAFVGLVAQGFLPESIYRMGRFYLLAGVLLAVIAAARGPKGWLEAARPLLNWRVDWRWYGLALLWAPGLAVIFLLGKSVLMGNGLTLPDLDWDRMSRLGVVRSVFIASFIGEIVWVSYAISQLSSKYSPFLASQIVGFFWALWWLPMGIFNVGIVQNVPTYAIFISIMAVAANCCFFYTMSRSALCVFIMQFLFNASLLVFPIIPNNGGAATYTAFSIVYWLVAFLMFNLMGPRPLFERRTALAG